RAVPVCYVRLMGSVPIVRLYAAFFFSSLRSIHESLFFYRYADLRDLHSFPTRRSSDLNYLDKAGITTACLRIKSKWTAEPLFRSDRKSGSAGMPRPNSYAVLCLKKKTTPYG